jgi:hypothetical protein
MKEVDEAEEMLRYNILQGRKNERGNYGASLKMFATFSFSFVLFF